MRVILKNENEIKSNTPTTIIVDREGYQKPATGISKTDLEQTIQTSLGRADSAYQKPVDGIPSTDLASGVIPAPEVFWATYGTTTAAEIDAAVAAGKMVCSIYNNQYCPLVHITNDYYSFISVNRSNGILRLDLHRSISVWSVGVFPIETKSNRVSSWQTTPDNTHYPSEKLVKDSLDTMAAESSKVTFRQW